MVVDEYQISLDSSFLFLLIERTRCEEAQAHMISGLTKALVQLQSGSSAWRPEITSTAAAKVA
jgi:hypothetical protein